MLFGNDRNGINASADNHVHSKRTSKSVPNSCHSCFSNYPIWRKFSVFYIVFTSFAENCDKICCIKQLFEVNFVTLLDFELNRTVWEITSNISTEQQETFSGRQYFENVRWERFSWSHQIDRNASQVSDRHCWSAKLLLRISGNLCLWLSYYMALKFMNISIFYGKIHKEQMMVIAELTFTTTLFGLYSLFQYIEQQNEYFRNYLLLHAYWFFYYLIFMFVTIYSSNMMTKEVSYLLERLQLRSIYHFCNTFNSIQFRVNALLGLHKT